MLSEHNSIQEQYPDANPQEIIAAMAAVRPTSSVIKAREVKADIQPYTFRKLPGNN
jgi:hypothetical protein